MQARGTDKDQSYVLYMLDQDQLAKAWFPMGEMPSKAATRDLARQLGLHLAEKPDSQEICFVSEAGGYAEFLRKNRPEIFASGDIVDISGEKLGTHEGVADYTVGQRKGIGLTMRHGRPLYVLELKPKENRVVVGEDSDLLQRDVNLDSLHWLVPPTARIRVRAKIRYNMDPKPAALIGGPEPKLIFDELVRAVTPGQIAVAYRGRTLVAGGTISSLNSR